MSNVLQRKQQRKAGILWLTYISGPRSQRLTEILRPICHISESNFDLRVGIFFGRADKFGEERQKERTGQMDVSLSVCSEFHSSNSKPTLK